MHAKRAIAAAAVAAAAHGATAFTTSMGMLHAASLRPSVCVPRHARGLALCMTEKQFAVEVDPAELQELLDEAARRYEDGMNPADAKKVLGEGKSVQEALDMLGAYAYAAAECVSIGRGMYGDETHPCTCRHCLCPARGDGLCGRLLQVFRRRQGRVH